MKLGLLMESAQAQQGLAGQALERLREHTAGLDAVVRGEIRATLIEELQAVEAESRRAAAALQTLQHAVGRRALLTGTATAVFASAIPLAGAWWLLPARGEIEALRATRARAHGQHRTAQRAGWPRRVAPLRRAAAPVRAHRSGRATLRRSGRLPGRAGVLSVRAAWQAIIAQLPQPVLLAGAALLLAIAALLVPRGPDRYRRGARVLEGRAARRSVWRRRLRYGRALLLAGVPVAPSEETRHFKLIGATGAGKSTAIAGLVAGALARGDRSSSPTRTAAIVRASTSAAAATWC